MQSALKCCVIDVCDKYLLLRIYYYIYKGASPGLPAIAGDRAPRRPLNG